MNKVLLKVDSRSKRWSVAKTFGEVSSVDFPSEFKVKESLPNFIQPVGDVKCVAISCCDVAQDKDTVSYQHEDLFNRIPHNENPQMSRSEITSNVPLVFSMSILYYKLSMIERDLSTFKISKSKL